MQVQQVPEVPKGIMAMRRNLSSRAGAWSCLAMCWPNWTYRLKFKVRFLGSPPHSGTAPGKDPQTSEAVRKRAAIRQGISHTVSFFLRLCCLEVNGSHY